MEDYTTNGQDYPLHPKFKGMVRLIRIVTIVLIVVSISLVLIFAAMIVTRPGGGPELKIVMIVFPIPIIIILIVLHFTLHRTIMPRLRAASRVMMTARPKQMSMKGLGFSDMNGFYVELRSFDQDDLGAPWGVAAVRGMKRSQPSKKSQPVMVYADESSPDDLVIESEKGIFWGKLTTPITRAAGFRKLGWLVGGMAVLFLLVIGMGLFVMQRGLTSAEKDLHLAEATLNWPTTEAFILASDVKSVRIRRGKGSVPGFDAAIEYQYEVNGRKYKGHQISICYSPMRDQAMAEAMVASFPEGATVSVAYHSDNPDFAVLKPGQVDLCQQVINQTKQQFMMIIIAGLCGVIVLVGVFLFMNARRKRLLGPNG